MTNKHEYQLGVSSRLRGISAENVGSKGYVDTRNQQQIGVGVA